MDVSRSGRLVETVTNPIIKAESFDTAKITERELFHS